MRNLLKQYFSRVFFWLAVSITSAQVALGWFGPFKLLVHFNERTLGLTGGLFTLNVLLLGTEVLVIIEITAYALQLLWRLLKYHVRKQSYLALLTTFLTLAFIGFEMLVPFRLRGLLGNDAIAWMREWAWLGLLFYLGVQFVETAVRNSTKIGEFAVENILAFIAVVIAIIILDRDGSSPGWTLAADEHNMMIKCLWYGLTDFGLGLVFALRIAFSGKERLETEIKA